MITETVIQGDTIQISVTFMDTASGVPVNLTGATARMAVVDALGVTKYITTTGLISNPTQGKVTHLIPTTVTNVPVDTQLFSDIEITYPTGVVRTYAQTTYIIAKGYTNV